MNREETDLVPRMKETFTDAELAAIRGTIIGRMPPDRLFALLGWMLPALNATELSGLLSSFQGKAPPEFVRKVTELCAQRVEPARWATVKGRVGI